MKQSEIIPGHIYFNEKKGAREVLEVKQAATSMVVKYKIRAEMYSVLKRIEVSTLSSFCTWAKTRLPPQEGVARSNRMHSEQVKLLPDEFDFMEAIAAVMMRDGRIPVIGRSRVAIPLILKGLLHEYGPDGSTKLTDMGQCWVDGYILAKSREEDNPADADGHGEVDDSSRPRLI